MTRSRPWAMLCKSWVLWAVVGCEENADLPSGWEDARSVEDFRQNECDRAAPAPDPASAAISATGVRGHVEVAYPGAMARCSQDLEGFWRRAGEGYEVLVQPVDMHPTTVPRCNCAYDLTMRVPSDAGPHRVVVYARSDRYGASEAPQPKRVGEAEATVP